MYEVPGLVATLRPNGQMLPLLPVGDGGLDGPMLRDRSAEIADEWCALVPGEPGGELLRCIDVGRDGVARGMMSLGS